MKVIELSWTKRSAFIVEQGPEQSVIQWLDTGNQQAVSNTQFQVVSTAKDFVPPKTDRVRAARQNSGEPTKMELAIEIVTNAKTFTRTELIQTIMDECKMSKAGATTYLYNAQKALKK